MQIPLDPKVKELADLPYTISYVIRKRQQIDNLSELPKDKRPPDSVIWEGTPEEMEEWITRVFDKNYKPTLDLKIVESEIEG